MEPALREILGAALAPEGVPYAVGGEVTQARFERVMAQVGQDAYV